MYTLNVLKRSLGGRDYDIDTLLGYLPQRSATVNLVARLDA